MAEELHSVQGLSRRDYLAGCALQGLLSDRSNAAVLAGQLGRHGFIKARQNNYFESPISAMCGIAELYADRLIETLDHGPITISEEQAALRQAALKRTVAAGEKYLDERRAS